MAAFDLAGLRARIDTALATVVDPELGLAITDLGLVRRVDLQPGRCSITLNMTSAACPQGDLIVDEVDTAVSQVLPLDMDLLVQLEWDPPWTPEAMNARARAFLHL